MLVNEAEAAAPPVLTMDDAAEIVIMPVEVTGWPTKVAPVGVAPLVPAVNAVIAPPPFVSAIVLSPVSAVVARNVVDNSL